MRKPAAPGLFGLVFAFYLVGFLASLGYSYGVFPPGGQELLERFRWPFVWSNAFLLLMDHLLPLTMAAVALSFSVGQPARGSRRGTIGFGHVLPGHLSLLIALTVLYSFLYLGVCPELRAHLGDFQSLSREASLYLSRAEQARAAGDHRAAALDYERYLVIDPENERIADRLNELRTSLPAAAAAAAPEPPETRYRVLTQGKQAFELLEMAQGFHAREDYASAHYYATLAVRLDPTRADALRLAAKSWQQISSTDLTREDERQRRLFLDKREGYRLFAEESYIQAYYRFRALRDRHPQDAELATWLERSRAMLVVQTFFLDEARKIDSLPGREELLLVNESRTDGLTEILHIGKMVAIEEGTFVKDVEVLRFGPDGPLQHYAARYGRLMPLHPAEQWAAAPGPAWTLNLQGVERTSREGPSLPRLLPGSPPRGEPLPLLVLSAGPQELPSLAVGETTAATVGFLQLWQMRPRVAHYGHSEPAVSAEIFRRLLHPFSFLVLSLAAAGFGWSARPRSLSGRPALAASLLIPLFPLVALFLSALYLHAQRVAMNFLLLQLGFAACLPIFLVMQGVVLFAVLVLLAGQPGE